MLRAADVADVAAGVRLAAAEGLRVAVRAGGHSWAAWSLRDDTLLIDLAAFTGMDYDEATGTVTVGPAVRGGLDLDPFLAAGAGSSPAGTARPSGWAASCCRAGWAGTAAAGAGRPSRSRRIQVVTASGDVAWCSARENADLFWAARGSGPGFFGVVTAFRLRTRPRYRELTQTTYVYPPRWRREVLHWLHAARHDVPSSVELVGGRHRAAASAGTRARRARRLWWTGSASTAGPGRCARSTAARSRTGPIVAKVAQPVTIAELRAEQMRANPEGHRYTVDNAYLAGPADALIPALTPAFTELPTAKSFSLWFDLAHLPARPLSAEGLPDMALSVQSDLYFATYVVGETPQAGRRLPVLGVGHDGPPGAVLGLLLPGRQRLHRPARPVHERRGVGPASARSARTATPAGCSPATTAPIPPS